MNDDPRVVSIIVPIFGDPASLAACAVGLSCQTRSAYRLIIVDDCSPDPRVSELGRQICSQLGGTFIRLSINAGFAAAANRGIATSVGGDVLILNSDVILPERALERMMIAASRKSVGTVTAFSNDGGHGSFPVPFAPSPLPSAADSRIIDIAAESANADGVVDLLMCHGACLYITRACLDAIGGFSTAFARGYYEDVDYGLRARENGFRNVLATGLYVAHASSRSFLGDRDSLVSRNRPIIARRFPSFASDVAAAMAADPQRRARAAVAERLPPKAARAVLVVGFSADHVSMFRRLKHHAGSGTALLSIEWSDRTAPSLIQVTSISGNVRGTCSFSIDDNGQERLLSYLGSIPALAIEVIVSRVLPARLLTVLRRAKRPTTLVAEGPEGVGEIRSRQTTAAFPTAWSCIAADRMTAAALQAPWGEPTPQIGARSRRSTNAKRIGVVMPHQDPEAERFIVALGRLCRPDPTVRFVVLGECLDREQVVASGKTDPLGHVAFNALADAIAQHHIDALLSPYRNCGFGFLDDLSRQTGCAKAYFDWSAGLLSSAAGDLALDRHSNDRDASGMIALWSKSLSADLA